MELLGTWKVKSMLSADENGVKTLGTAEIEALGDEDLVRLLHSEFIVTESSIDVYYQPTAEELPIAEEEGWEITDKGILLESYPAKIEDGVFKLNYEKDGVEYTPVETDGDGGMIIGGMTTIEKI